ncbi:hypothetical protein BS50DRAFT_315965 [Corynespora cassiicola Philippines]|uniref:Uncharacterized protein n=1 Tax=Corynespora cassiicola Philippines TaxID=1448308 RepID=A0A2T2NZK6_CORCC|nr:hypothetical protein BS50DRAFT_315965 [Corynespora cassiicola Philippines]
MVWNSESIIALVTLFVTCAPMAALLWGCVLRRARRSQSQDIEDIESSASAHSQKYPMIASKAPPSAPPPRQWAYIVRRESSLHAIVAIEHISDVMENCEEFTWAGPAPL